MTSSNNNDEEKKLQQQLHPREEPESIEADRVGGWREPNQPRRINNKRNRGYRRESFPNVEEQEKKRELGNKLTNLINNQGARDAAGATYEITSGVAFDAITTPLGLAPPLYAALNFGEGSINNVIAQKIRGRKWNEIDWNEVISSGVLGIVPLSQLKAAKYLKKPVAETVEKVVGKQDTLQRYIASGAITGGGDVTIRSGLAGEAPSPENLAAGTVGGAVIGGTLSPLLRQLSKTVTGIVQQKRVS